MEKVVVAAVTRQWQRELVAWLWLGWRIPDDWEAHPNPNPNPPSACGEPSVGSEGAANEVPCCRALGLGGVPAGLRCWVDSQPVVQARVTLLAAPQPLAARADTPQLGCSSVLQVEATP